MSRKLQRPNQNKFKFKTGKYVKSSEKNKSEKYLRMRKPFDYLSFGLFDIIWPW